MDYRKPRIFGENWSPERYRVLPYFAHERVILGRSRRLLDLGCAAGWNMSRFRQIGLRPMGADINPHTLPHARAHGPVALASGLQLPFADAAFDAIYVQHVLHHIGNVEQALSEIWRCLEPGGTLFLIETVEDNPIIRYGRRLYPHWLGDEVNAPFYFAGLQQLLAEQEFRTLHAAQYSVLFWLWEIIPDQIPALEKLTPFFVPLEEHLQRWFNRHSAHCFCVAVKEVPQGETAASYE
jgi:SAM-dependent methyltransferase